jgi:MFS family permease
LEFIAQVGVSIFITALTVVVSDVTARENRGRFVAVRTMLSRAGQVAGPATGGLIVAVAGLRYVFLFDTFTKFIIVLVVLLLIRETRPKTAPRAEAQDGQQGQEKSRAPRFRVDLKPFASPTFLALGAAAIAGTMIQQGITFTILPVHATEIVGISEGGLGALVSMAALFGVLVAYPIGIISDRFGRRFSLAPGLAMLAVGLGLLVISPSYAALVLAMAAFGIGEGMTMGTTQAFVMDLAPAESRGTFLGLWSSVRGIASVPVPVGMGALYEFYGPEAAFTVGLAWMVLAVVLMVTVAKESAGRSRQTAQK